MHGSFTGSRSVDDTAAAMAFDGNSVTIPDAHLLFSGDFKRSGDSLKIVGDDGKTVVVPDYFKSDQLATLLAPDGAALTGDVVGALAGPQAPGQYAQAGAPAGGAQEIGRVATVQGNAVAVRNGVAVTLNVGDAVLKGDVVQTQGSGSALGLIFADGTAFNLSANARMVLNEFVYNPAGSTNSALINLVQGSFTFIAGEVAKTGDMKVGTPVATMGIRGTAVQVDINLSDGTTKMSVLVEPNGVVGSFNVYSLSGTLIGTVNNAGLAAVIAPTGALNATMNEVTKSPAELQQALQIVQAVVQTQAVGQAILAAQPVAPAPNDGNTEKQGSDSKSSIEVATTKVAVTIQEKSTGTTITEVKIIAPIAEVTKTTTLNYVGPQPTTLVTAIADQSFAEDTPWSFRVPSATFRDADTPVLTFTAKLANGSALPSWLFFNGDSQTFSGTPPQDFNGSLDITVTAGDGSFSASSTFTLTVARVNDQPLITSAAALVNFAGNALFPQGYLTAVGSTNGTIAFKDVDLADTPDN